MTGTVTVDPFDVLAVVVRFLIFGGTIVLIGGLALRYSVFARVLSIDGASAITTVIGRRLRVAERAVAAVLLPAILLRLLLEIRDFASDLGWFAATRGVLTGMTWGKGWLMQAVGVGAVLAGQTLESRPRDPDARLGSSGRRGSLGTGLTTAGVFALAVAPALTGHAVASPTHPALAVVADSLHVVAAGVWLGTLSLVLVVGIRATADLPHGSRAPLIAELVAAFSPLALAGAATVLLTGVVGTWLHLDQISALWRTPYGQVLAAKLSLFCLVVAAGAYNWRRATPRVMATERGVHALQRSVVAELAFSAVLLVLTAVLVAMAPPGDA